MADNIFIYYVGISLFIPTLSDCTQSVLPVGPYGFYRNPAAAAAQQLVPAGRYGGIFFIAGEEK